ncbi:hypothetical protein DFP73DRAFT_598449 [Morchella snyderi]|nr:hypothetical protein DFP73DRAFT_598449 [Morchella snyderi]
MPPPHPDILIAMESIGIVHADADLIGPGPNNNEAISTLFQSIYNNPNTIDEIRLILTLLGGIVEQNAIITGDIARHAEVTDELATVITRSNQNQMATTNRLDRLEKNADEDTEQITKDKKLPTAQRRFFANRTTPAPIEDSDRLAGQLSIDLGQLLARNHQVAPVTSLTVTINKNGAVTVLPPL